MSPSPKFSFGNCCGFVCQDWRSALKTVPPVVKIHAATKKRILLFGRMRAKSLVDIFRQMR